jgi:hypothetical protein
MTPMEKVKERHPGAYLAPYPVAGVWDVIVESNRPSPGYRSHKALGAGTTPQLAWADAAKRVLRRKWKRPSQTVDACNT